MITVILIVVVLLLAGGYLFSNRGSLFVEKESNVYGTKVKEEGLNFKIVGVALAVFVVGFLAAMIQPFSLERVDAGHVGIKFTLSGDKRGISKYEYASGWVIINNWVERLYEFPTFQQTKDYGENLVITKGGFPAKIHPKFNYNLIPGNIGDMFSNLRQPLEQIEDLWLKNAVLGAMNDVANTWTIDDIFNKREQFEGNIALEANKRVSKWFTMSQLRTNIIPPDALVESINKKTQAIQDVQVAENEAKVAFAQGEKKVAEARADSSQRVIRAAGEAEEIRRKQLTLTPIYIEYIKWINAEPDLPRVPQVLSGSSSSMLYNIK
jgi:regulator of protease activity HflC (stomatin/prohibitin superfamily)